MDFPFDIWRNIFCLLDETSLLSLSVVSKSLHALVQDESIWSPIYKDYYLELPKNNILAHFASFRKYYKEYLPVYKKVRRIVETLRSIEALSLREGLPLELVDDLRSKMSIVDNDGLAYFLLHHFHNGQHCNESTSGLFGGFACYNDFCHLYWCQLNDSFNLSEPFPEDTAGGKLYVDLNIKTKPEFALENVYYGSDYSFTLLGSFLNFIERIAEYNLHYSTQIRIHRHISNIFLPACVSRENLVVEITHVAAVGIFSVSVWTCLAFPDANANGVDVALYTYNITIFLEESHGIRCQLKKRHWTIQYEDGLVEQMSGDGVVGYSPVFDESGMQFTYNSYCQSDWENPTKTMFGTFEFCTLSGETFHVNVPRMKFQTVFNAE